MRAERARPRKAGSKAATGDKKPIRTRNERARMNGSARKDDRLCAWRGRLYIKGCALGAEAATGEQQTARAWNGRASINWSVRGTGAEVLAVSRARNGVVARRAGAQA